MQKVISESYKDVLVIDFLCSAINNETEVKELSDMLDHYLITAVQKNILVDLSRVQFMTSAMIGALVRLKKDCAAKKITLKLCGLSGSLEEVFKVTRMCKLFKIYQNRDRALGRVRKAS